MATKFYKSLFGRDVARPESPSQGSKERGKDHNSRGGGLKEIGLNKPFSYTGVHQDFSTWLSSVKLYLATNEHIYYEDQSKITFALSYMGSGSACTFTEAYINDNTTTLGDLKIFNGWDEFVAILKETFQSLNEYITNFHNCLNKAQISTKDSTAAVFFGKGLNEEINKWILMAGPKPDTVEDWIHQATVACTVMATLKVFSAKATYQDCSYLWKQEQTSHRSRSSSSLKTLYRDPYAMDVDWKSKVQSQSEAPTCYGCGKTGHMKSKCPLSATNSRSSSAQKFCTRILAMLEEFDKASEDEEEPVDHYSGENDEPTDDGGPKGNLDF
ncbi:hypothetical protein M404DRAFT_26788 [Pisolithus tinctorius Marx 270]|uniref:CCHC-type domain-containing protein n=1 Tax=Pisolithus tinctorius Marx 270 TaxID=870435 RepID=A0A0C3P8L8_PISTI|nr:hypothetical protein M404DRAFT_26788 [Pisolithus tinctorius Marx 270]